LKAQQETTTIREIDVDLEELRKELTDSISRFQIEAGRSLQRGSFEALTEVIEDYDELGKTILKTLAPDGDGRRSYSRRARWDDEGGVLSGVRADEGF
jgi:hypothetical protein